MREWGLRWFEPAPARRLALLRILVGSAALLYVVVRAQHLMSFGRFAADRFDPVGPVGVLLDGPLPAWLVTVLVAATIAAGVAFVAGWRFPVSGPAFALLLLWVTTYRNSWGLVLHTENLMVLHVLALSLAPAADAHAADARAGRLRGPGGRHWAYNWPIRVLALVAVLAYFVSGWAKVRNGGWDWVTGDVLRNQIANDNLRKLLAGDFYSPLGGWLTRYGWVFPPLALATQVVELGAPLALFGRRLGQLWAGAAWLFHAGIVALMMIVFPYQLVGVAFAPFFAVERGYDRVAAAWRRVSRTVPAAPYHPSA